MKDTLALFGVLLVIVAMVAGAALAEPFETYDPVEEAYAARIRAETEADMAWRATARPVKLALYALFGGVGVLALGLGTWAGFLFLRRRACTVYADANGVMPAVILRRGEFLADLGALAGPMVVGQDGPAYRLPAGEVPRLQAAANQGAAMTRTMRAWATRQVAPRQEVSPWPALQAPREDRSGEFPPVEILTGDEAHILRLLEEGDS